MQRPIRRLAVALLFLVKLRRRAHISMQEQEDLERALGMSMEGGNGGAGLPASPSLPRPPGGGFCSTHIKGSESFQEI